MLFVGKLKKVAMVCAFVALAVAGAGLVVRQVRAEDKPPTKEGEKIYANWQEAYGAAFKDAPPAGVFTRQSETPMVMMGRLELNQHFKGTLKTTKEDCYTFSVAFFPASDPAGARFPGYSGVPLVFDDPETEKRLQGTLRSEGIQPVLLTGAIRQEATLAHDEVNLGTWCGFKVAKVAALTPAKAADYAARLLPNEDERAGFLKRVTPVKVGKTSLFVRRLVVAQGAGGPRQARFDLVVVNPTDKTITVNPPEVILHAGDQKSAAKFNGWSVPGSGDAWGLDWKWEVGAGQWRRIDFIDYLSERSTTPDETVTVEMSLDVDGQKAKFEEKVKTPGQRPQRAPVRSPDTR